MAMGGASQTLVSVCFVSLASSFSGFLLIMSMSMSRSSSKRIKKQQQQRIEEEEEKIDKAAEDVAAVIPAFNNKYLPELLTEEILLRVAVKDLVRYRFVSKSWCALISDPYFVNKHLQHSIQTNTHVGLILMTKQKEYSTRCNWIKTKSSRRRKDDDDDDEYYKKYRPHIEAVDLDNLLKLHRQDDHELCDPIRASVDEFYFKPLSHMKHYNKIEGSCNGLVCLSSTLSRRNVALWNPLTGKIHELPDMPVHLELDVRNIRRILHVFPLELWARVPLIGRIAYGFGHDRESDDYKVVGLERLYYPETNMPYSPTIVWIYSLKTNSWRSKHQTLEYFPCKNTSGIFASTGNALHWLMTQRCYIGALDLGEEEEEGDNNGWFHEVQKPDYYGEFNNNANNTTRYDASVASLGVLRGCLCVCSGFAVSTDIWVMKEYGVKESWTRLISFVAAVPDSYTLKTPLAYSRCGNQVVLLDCSHFKLMWYDLKTKTVTRVVLLGFEEDRWVGGQACVLSLLDPT